MFTDLRGRREVKQTKKKEREGQKGATAPTDTGRSDLRPVPKGKEGSLVAYDPLQAYLWEIRRYTLLTKEEEIELAIRYRERNDLEAAHKLVLANLRLVVKIAMDFHRYWMKNLMDLIQEGNVGLMQAVRKFDPHKGIKFSYYASFWIKAYILKFIMENWKLVKIGTTQAQRKLFFNLTKEKERLLSLGYDPEPKLLAERLDVKQDEIIEMAQRLGGWEVSLDAPVKEDAKQDYGSFLPSSDRAIDEQISLKERGNLLREKLEEYRGTLSGKQRDIFDNRILSEDPLTLQELGDKYKISRERVRQIQEKILMKAKEWLTEEIPNFEENFSDLLHE
ncbi:MAG: RNA polymerase factor sigma-32 [Deltaproteobacteria bacterium]|nr:MAG: RNA polymerase factor sigma-32 [Deltaproteobacteria bacterium]